MAEKVTITTGARLHLALIDLNGSLGRIDGSIGLAVSNPRICIDATPSIDVSTNKHQELVASAVHKLRQHFGVEYGLRVTFRRDYPAHVGLGSTTQILLSIAKAYCLLYDLPGTARDLARVVGRGGTSGIGVAAFASGGFILDAGHSFGPKKQKTTFLPSRASTAPPPPVVLRTPFPANWTIDLVVPPIGSGLSGQNEINFFQTVCPISLEETQHLCHIVFSQIIPGILEHDIEVFSAGVNSLAYIGFKKHEVSRQPQELRSLIENLHKRVGNLASLGMSSFGPTLYFIYDRAHLTRTVAKVRERLQSFSRTHDALFVTTRGRNSGATATVQ